MSLHPFGLVSGGLREGDEALEVMVGVAELVVDHDQALGVVGQSVVPGHGDAAVELDRLLRDQAPDAPHEVLGRRERALQTPPD